ncbi:MAG: YiiX/YebB-like N1pC/P60 family cysteine hydrolase [Pseudohongiellaceae bacterium]|nr:YiiX/YebB-like N1pC/P60 family cysteine hydrolase [Pseudohongiellaceae bacterium]
MNEIARKIGRRLAAFLSRPLPDYARHDSASIDLVLKVIEPGDILLVDGNSRISTAIKYLTQSTWSHACLYVGADETSVDSLSLIEADLQAGVTRVALKKYENYNLRICRAVGINAQEKAQLIDFVEERIGHQYDLKNIFDLMRFLIQNPAVPPRYRRQLISLGSGEPTKAICSTLIAQAFQSIHYPILPNTGLKGGDEDELQHRHFSHFVPRDFDISPYFEVVKPTIAHGFNFRELTWKVAESGNAEGAKITRDGEVST